MSTVDTEKRREHRRRWYAANKDKHLENVRKWQAANPDKVREASKTWLKNNPEKSRQKSRRKLLKKEYGLSVKQYDQMLIDQGGVCAICERDNPGGNGAFHVDHDHKTGKIRGLLCSRCNPGLGLFGDDPELLETAANYIRRNI